MNRPLGALLLAASLAACAPDDVVRPDDARAARITLSAAGPSTLASLGDSAVIRPHVLDERGASMPDAPLRWSIAPAGIVQEDAEGVYRAIANGRVTIVAEIGLGETGVRPAGYWASRVADSVVIEVRQRAARLALAPVDTAFTTIGARRPLRVQVTDARGNAMLGGPPPLAWGSTDGRVVQVDGAGIVRSLAEGTARVTVQAEDLVGSATFTVQPRLPHTSCMVFAQRRQSRQSCVTLDFVMREREDGR